MGRRRSQRSSRSDDLVKCQMCEGWGCFIIRPDDASPLVEATCGECYGSGWFPKPYKRPEMWVRRRAETVH